MGIKGRLAWALKAASHAHAGLKGEQNYNGYLPPETRLSFGFLQLIAN
jgi:hypothetical protein